MSVYWASVVPPALCPRNLLTGNCVVLLTVLISVCIFLWGEGWGWVAVSRLITLHPRVLALASSGVVHVVGITNLYSLEGIRFLYMLFLADSYAMHCALFVFLLHHIPTSIFK